MSGIFYGSFEVQATEVRGGKQIWRTLAPFGMLSRFGTIVVPEGFETDFASVPGCAKWFVDDDAPCILFGSLIHDYLYARGGRLERLTLSFDDCNEVLREAMLACGASRLKAAIVYRCVRTFGRRWFSRP